MPVFVADGWFDNLLPTLEYFYELLGLLGPPLRFVEVYLHGYFLDTVWKGGV